MQSGKAAGKWPGVVQALQRHEQPLGSFGSSSWLGALHLFGGQPQGHVVLPGGVGRGTQVVGFTVHVVGHEQVQSLGFCTL